MNEIAKAVDREASKLCASAQSKFRDSSPEALESFRFSDAIQELHHTAPVLSAVLRACTGKGSESRNGDNEKHVVAAASCLLKSHNPQMSCLPYIVSIALYHAGAKKRTYKRLNRMGLAMSHRMTLVKIDELAKRNDKKLLQWKSDVQVFSSAGHVAPYQITGDNLDLEIRTKVMTLSRQNKSLHWFNMVATKERVYNSIATGSQQQPSILSLDPGQFLSSASDDTQLRSNFVELTMRVLCQNLKDLRDFTHSVIDHIPHKYSNESAEQSEQVLLGILELNENKQKDMIDIIRIINNKYVPYQQNSDGTHDPVMRIFFGGDQLTVERARGAQKAVLDGNTQYDRMGSLIPKIEDFHAQINLLDTIFQKFYSTLSSGDPGTLYHLRTLLNRRNVVKDPKKAYDACSAFLDDVLNGHLLACGMAYFGLTEKDDKFVPRTVKCADDKTRRSWLCNKVERMLDKFVLVTTTMSDAGSLAATQVISTTEEPTTTVTSPSDAQQLPISTTEVQPMLLCEQTIPSATATNRESIFAVASDAHLSEQSSLDTPQMFHCPFPNCHTAVVNTN